MPRFIASIITLLLCVWTAMAQTLSCYEYWFDDNYKDRVLKNSGNEINISADCNGLEEGVHYFNFRAFDSTGKTGPYYRYVFYYLRPKTLQPSIAMAEYWIDEDYASVQTQQVSGQSFALDIDLQNVPVGVHYLNIRLMGANGSWSTIKRHIFFVSRDQRPQTTLKSVEYWLDEDYASKKNSPISGESFFLDVNLESLQPGVHFFNYRVMNSLAEWGPFKRHIIFVPQQKDVFSNEPIVGYAYYFGKGEEKFVEITPTKSFMIVDQPIEIPQLKDCYPIDDKCKFSIVGNTITLERNEKVPFGLRLKNANGIWSQSTLKLIEIQEKLAHLTQDLSLRQSVTFVKNGIGDFGALKIEMEQSGGYFLKTSQKADMFLFNADGSLYMSLKAEELVNAKQIPLYKGSYYGIVYNMITDKENASEQVTVRLMLTENYVATPTFNYDGENLTIQCEQEGAIIRYTTDGTNPDESSPIYTEPIAIDHNCVIKAYATYEDYSPSDIASYQVDWFKVENLQFSFANLELQISCPTEKSEIYYTIDGSDPAINGQKYTGPISLTQSCTVKALGRREGYKDSEVATYVFDATNVKCGTPLFKLSGNTLSIETQESNASIRYTTDGSEPTKESTVYTAPIKLTQNCTIKAIVVKEGYINSETGSYVVDWFQVELPKFDFTEGKLTITTDTSGARIYYTVDGTTPNESSKLYTEPIKIEGNQTVKAIAYADNFNPSDVASYTIGSFKVETPVISFADSKVTISCGTEKAQIYYTTDGSSPLTNGKLYSAPIEINVECTVKAIAKRDGYNDSDVATYEVAKCATPSITVIGNNLYIQSEDDNVIIHYTMDSSEPNAASVIYTGQIKLVHNCTVKAYAHKDGCLDSDTITYEVDTFQVGLPAFKYEEGLLSISVDILDAKIYYTLGGDEPDEKSTLYTGPITITDNRVVKARAYAENFHPSEVATYNFDMFTCESAVISYDGRYVTMTTPTVGASIYYTTDGSNPISSSTLYSGRFDVEGLCTVKAVVMKEYTNNSNVTSFEIDAYYDGECAQTSYAGVLSKAFGWCDTSDCEELQVIGSLNQEDLVTIADRFPKMKHLDISDTRFPNNELPTKAFANSPILTIQMPSSLSKVGQSIFEGCNRLAAIEWNSYITLPSTAMKGFENPNLLLYVAVKSYAPREVRNVVVDNVAESITLTDNAPGANNNFYCPQEFTARKINYTHSYTQGTIPNVCAGWETITLPFDVQSIRHASAGEILPFAALPNSSQQNTTAKPFWLYALSSHGFEASDRIEANTPYILSMPNNDVYADEYILSGDVTFSAENVLVPVTEQNISHKGQISFVPTTVAIQQSPDVYAINRYEMFEGKEEGSHFVSDLRRVEPFEGYWRIEGAGHKVRALSIFDVNDLTGLMPTPDLTQDDGAIRIFTIDHTLYIESEIEQRIYIHSINGTLVRIVDVQEGINAVEDLLPGFYIVKEQKVVIK